MVGRVCVLEEDTIAKCRDFKSPKQKDPCRFTQFDIENGLPVEEPGVFTYGRDRQRLRLAKRTFVPPLSTVGLCPHSWQRAMLMVILGRGHPNMIFASWPFDVMTFRDPVPLEKH
jgi:hypothetical protein